MNRHTTVEVDSVYSFRYTSGSGGNRLVKVSKVDHDGFEGEDYTVEDEPKFRRFLFSRVSGQISWAGHKDDSFLPLADVLREYKLPDSTSLEDAASVLSVYNPDALVLELDDFDIIRICHGETYEVSEKDDEGLFVDEGYDGGVQDMVTFSKDCSEFVIESDEDGNLLVADEHVSLREFHRLFGEWLDQQGE